MPWNIFLTPLRTSFLGSPPFFFCLEMAAEGGFGWLVFAGPFFSSSSDAKASSSLRTKAPWSTAVVLSTNFLAGEEVPELDLDCFFFDGGVVGSRKTLWSSFCCCSFPGDVGAELGGDGIGVTLQLRVFFLVGDSDDEDSASCCGGGGRAACAKGFSTIQTHPLGRGLLLSPREEPGGGG